MDPLIPPSAGGRDGLTPTLPNKYQKRWGEWHCHKVNEASYVKSVEAAPAVGYILNGAQPPNEDRIEDYEFFPIKNGFGVMPYPGTWWIYWVQPSSAAGSEQYVLKPAVNLRGLELLLAIESFPQGFDLIKWGGTLLSAAQAGSADANFAKALVAGLVNTRPSLYSAGAADWVIHKGEAASASAGRLASDWVGAYQLASLHGRDTGDGSMRPIEARGSALAVATNLYRLLVDAQPRLYDWASTNLHTQMGGRDSAADNFDHAIVQQGRESGYHSSIRGRRFLISGEGVAQALTSGFTATIPQVIVVPGAALDFVVRKITASMSIVAGTPPALMRVVLDTANRYSSGGTSRTPFNMNGGSAAAAAFTQVKDGAAAITATAAGGGTREMGTQVLKTLVGEPYVREYEDGLIVPSSGSLLLYFYAGDTAGRVHWEIEGEEVNVQ